MEPVEARPPGLNVFYRPGDPLKVVLTWPAGSLAGRTFTSTLGATVLGLSVVGDVMTITATPAQTAAATSQEWELVDTTPVDDVTMIVGRWVGSDGAGGPPQATVAVTTATGNVAVTVAGAGPLATSIDALPAATTPLAGTELVPGLQVGVGVKITTADLAGGPVETLAGVSRDRHRWAEDFDGFTGAFTTNAAVLGEAKVRTNLAGAGSSVTQSQGVGESGVVDLSTGTTTTGRCAIEPNNGLLVLFSNTDRFAMGARVKMPVVSDGTDTYRVIIGIASMSTSTPADGFIFRSPTAAGNWSAVVRVGGADADVTDTGVAVDSNGAFHTFVVEFDPVFSGARWYIDGVLVASETTVEPAGVANIGPLGVGIHKSAGTTARVVRVDNVSWNVPAGARWAKMP